MSNEVRGSVAEYLRLVSVILAEDIIGLNDREMLNKVSR